MSCTPRCESGISSDVYFRKLLRRQWRAAWIIGGQATCDVWRYTGTSAGDPPAGVPPGYSLDAGLTAVPVVVNLNGRYEPGAHGSAFTRFREGEVEFGFVDLPSAGGVAAGVVQLSDFVYWDGRVWGCDPNQGGYARNDAGVRSYLRAQLWSR